MKPLIAIVDYEMGNLHSVSKALEASGGRVIVTDSPTVLARAAAVVLPGVGAFGQAIKRLRSKDLIRPILQALDKQKPFLGICLGLQMLFERSEESPKERGLGLFKGSVVRFGHKRGSAFKVPHMGWNTLRGGSAKSRCLRAIPDKSYFYFVHSYYPDPQDRTIVATETEYGYRFCSSVASKNIFASQFHPEKSGANGLRIMRNFVQEVAACS